MKAIIGISSYEENNKGQYNLNTNYVDAVLDAGGLPIIIPIIRNEEDAERYLDTIDGIIFSGGIDISPLNYDENPLKEINRMSSVRDNYEIMLFKKAYERKMPILGICRGSQLMNVCLGGNLYQDINIQVGDSLGHSPSSMAGDEFFHSSKIEKDSNFYNIFGEKKILVNSFHHQAIKDLGNNLKAVAYAEDGIIEAIEATDERFMLGVQFHPEELQRKHKEFLGIFKALVGAAK